MLHSELYFKSNVERVSGDKTAKLSLAVARESGLVWMVILLSVSLGTA